MASIGLLPEDVMDHVVDVHCHPTDATDREMENCRATICLMSMNQDDQPKVRDLAKKYPDKVIPYFGYHPWFTHFISLKKCLGKEEHYNSIFLSESASEKQRKEFQDLLPHLPEPIFLDDLLKELRSDLDSFPHSHVGEVGLDRVFRVSHDYYASPRTMTSFNIPIEHQLAICEAQVDLAVEMGRNISVHSVKAQQFTVQLLDTMAKRHEKKWNRISVDLHSCGLSSQMWKQVEKKHNNVFLSVSTLVNKRSPNHRDLIGACSPNRILVESDSNELDDCIKLTCDVLSTVAEVKGWRLEDSWQEELDRDDWGAVRTLEENFRIFKEGDHPVTEFIPRKKKFTEYEELTSDED